MPSGDQASESAIAVVEQPFTLLRAPAPQRRYLREACLAGFQPVIVEAYRQTCALCGLRLVTPERHTAVAAAHLVRLSP